MREEQVSPIQAKRAKDLEANGEFIAKLNESVAVQTFVEDKGPIGPVRIKREDITSMVRQNKKAVETDIDALVKEAKDIDTEIKRLNEALKTVDQYIESESRLPIVDPVKIKYLQEQAEKFDKRRQEAEEKARVLEEKLNINSPGMKKIAEAHERRLDRAGKLAVAAGEDIEKQKAILESATKIKESLSKESKAARGEKGTVDSEIKKQRAAIDEIEKESGKLREKMNKEGNVPKAETTVELQKLFQKKQVIEKTVQGLEARSEYLQNQLNEIKAQSEKVKGVIKQAKSNISKDEKDIKFDKEERASVKRQEGRLEAAKESATESVKTAQKIETLATKQEGQEKSRSEKIGELGGKGVEQQEKEAAKGFGAKWKEAFDAHRYVKDRKGVVHNMYTPAQGPKKGLGFLGNSINGVMNAVGATTKVGCEYAGKGLQALGDLANKPLDAARKNFSEAKGAAKVGWGFAVAGAAMLKLVGSVTKIAGKGVEAMGTVLHEGCAVMGAAARAVTRPFSSESWRGLGSATVKLATSTVGVATDMIKETGTELKDLGNRVNVPGVTQTLRLIGGTTQAIAQGTEGIVQGMGKMARGEIREGGKVIGSGVASGAVTFASDVQTVGQQAKVGIDRRKIEKLDERIMATTDERELRGLVDKRNKKLESVIEASEKVGEKAAKVKPSGDVTIGGIGNEERQARARHGTSGGLSEEQSAAKRKAQYEVDHTGRKEGTKSETYKQAKDDYQEKWASKVKTSGSSKGGHVH